MFNAIFGFIFEQMHLHWGEKDDHGSEHVIDGKIFSGEIHLVHFNSKYGDFDTAANHRDGLVVVAFFIQAKGDKKNKMFAKITDQIPNARELHAKSFLAADCLKWMSTQELDKHYFMYHGSLTTPPYSEAVTWIIYRKPIHVSKQQIAAFRKLRAADNIHQITKNRRQLQTPHKRLTVIFAGKP
ncbi:carbonic anhydrase 1-like [Contarinia nasturtii]|uniref:carbonic anhydrase 1-like n=1 Tax=Contarinia nasturtii TaxID=265458 RepID=UPI0012D49F10|nr:carbonic anhydrase 1-like [Contarinia nasturtii]